MNTQFRPEAFYDMTKMNEIRVIPDETAVVGIATRFDPRRRELHVDLGGYLGIIPESEITIEDFTYKGENDIPCQIFSTIGTKVRAIVTDIDGNILRLSRKRSMMQAWEKIEEDSILTACVTKCIECGIFLDIGNGIVSYSHRKDCTPIAISNTNRWYEVGKRVKIKILDKGENAKSKIICSQKMVYPGMDRVNEVVSVNDIINVRIGKETVPGGYFCAVNPQISGIIDTTRKLYEGQRVIARVKSITPKGVRLEHLS